MRVCIYKARRTYGAGISIVYLKFDIFKIEYTLRVCIQSLDFNQQRDEVLSQQRLQLR